MSLTIRALLLHIFLSLEGNRTPAAVGDPKPLIALPLVCFDGLWAELGFES